MQFLLLEAVIAVAGWFLGRVYLWVSLLGLLRKLGCWKLSRRLDYCGH